MVQLLRLLTSKCSIIEQFSPFFAQRLSKMSIFALKTHEYGQITRTIQQTTPRYKYHLP